MQVRSSLASMMFAVNSESELGITQKAVPATLALNDVYAIKEDKAKEAALVSDYLEALVRSAVMACHMH